MTVGLIALVLAVLAFAAFAPAFRGASQRLPFLTVLFGFSFWYWLPALNLLTVGFIGIDDFILTPTVDDACWITLLDQLITLGLLLLIRPALCNDAPSREALIPIKTLALTVLGSAGLYLAFRFATLGFAEIIEMLAGKRDARASMVFFNRSQSAQDSLIGLWDLCNLWTALFCIGWYVFNHRTFSPGGLAALGALFLSYAGSGTRAILLQGLAAIAMAVILRPKVPRSPSFASVAVGGVLILALLLAIYPVLMARFDRDSQYAAAGPMAAITGTFITNNDMMRELTVAIDAMPPSFEGALDFAMTPFNDLMPSFWGFQKHFPIHSLNYNKIRADIDLEFGEGNVFPGLVGDFWLLFGVWGAPIFAAFIAAFSIATNKFAQFVRDPQCRTIYQLVLYSYLVFCFRNLTPHLSLIGLFGVGVLWILTRVRRPQLVERSSDRLAPARWCAAREEGAGDAKMGIARNLEKSPNIRSLSRESGVGLSKFP